MPPDRCPFCHPEPDRIAFQNDTVYGYWDAFPVTPGHILVIPRRHVATWFEATAAERAALNDGLDEARRHVERKTRPDGYNIGINVGKAGGRTVDHLHVHLIPRTDGDVANARGGIRNVIPGKGDYMAPKPSRPTPPRLITGGEDDALLPYLAEHLAQADAADIAVGFIQPSGVTRMEEHLRDYLGITDPDALMRLVDLEGDRELRVFETVEPPNPEWPGPSRALSFHPKSSSRSPTSPRAPSPPASSGTTASSPRRKAPRSPTSSPRSSASSATPPRARSTRPGSTTTAAATQDVELEVVTPPEPHAVQQEALAALEATRAEGYTAGLVVLATGLGKTWLSAFDSNRPEFARILFVAHREEILTAGSARTSAKRPLRRPA